MIQLKNLHVALLHQILTPIQAIRLITPQAPRLLSGGACICEAAIYGMQIGALPVAAAAQAAAAAATVSGSPGMQGLGPSNSAAGPAGASTVTAAAMGQGQ